ncbi:MAG: c-type cytochrome [Pararhizobium sp.]
MQKTPIILTVLALTAGIAVAADNPIAIRQALMDSNGAAAGLAGSMLKGETPYSPAAGKAAIATLHATSVAFGSFFPENSKTGDHTKASPKIWSDAAGFQKALEKFQSDASAAMKAAGEEGPADLASFKAAIMPVLGNCKSCHQDYRVRQ